MEGKVTLGPIHGGAPCGGRGKTTRRGNRAPGKGGKEPRGAGDAGGLRARVRGGWRGLSPRKNIHAHVCL